MKKYFDRVGRYFLAAIFLITMIFPSVSFATDGVSQAMIPETGEIIQPQVENDSETRLGAANAELTTTSITSPGTLEMQMNIVAGQYGIGSVNLKIADVNGQEKTLTATTENITGEGTLKTLYFPVGKTIVKGEYEIREISVFDTEYNVRSYNKAGSEWPFGNLRFTVTESETDDNIAPVLNSVTVKTPGISSPGTLELDMGILEEGVGVKYISVESSFWWDDFVFEPQGEVLKGNGDPQTISFEVPGSSANHTGSKFYIVSITICDNNDNKTVYTQGNSEWTFGSLQYEITKTPHDEAPEIKSISVKTPETTAPGVIELDMGITKGSDDTIGYILIELKNENGGRLSLDATDLSCRADGNPETVAFKVPASAGVGKWSVRYVNVIGLASGSRSYMYVNSPNDWEFGALDIMVTESEREDYDVPVLKSLSVRTPEVTSPGTLELDLGILEEGSGCSYILVSLEEDFMVSLNAEIGEGAVLKGNGEPQTVSFKIPEKRLGKQSYTIKSVWLWDASGNNKNYYCQELGFASGSYPQFTVTRTTNDDAPTITSAVIRNTNITLPGTLEIDMSFGGANDVKAVELSLRDGVGTSKTVEGRVSQGGQTYSFALDETFEAGAYEVMEVRVTDSSDAVTTYGKDDPAWAFGEMRFETTKAGNIEKTEPTVDQVLPMTTSITSPGTLEMQMNIAAGKYGIGLVRLSVVDNKGQTKTLAAEAANITGEGTLKTLRFPVDQTIVKGEYEIREISVFDTEYNVRFYNKAGSEWSFGDLRFTVTESETDDNIAPALQSVAVRTPEVSSPGTLELDMGILEEGVGIKYIVVGSDRWWSSFYFAPPEETPILKGNGDPQTISFNIPSTVLPAGDTFEIVSIRICDNNDNVVQYTKNIAGWTFGNLSYKVVKTQNEDAPTISGVSVKTPALSAPGNLDLTMKLHNGLGGDISSLNLELKDANGQRKTISSSNAAFIGDGSEETVSFKIDSILAKGDYKINSIWIWDTQDKFRYYNYYDTSVGWSFEDLKFTITEAETDDNIAPDIKSLNIRTPDVTSPGTLELDLGILEEGVGVNRIWIVTTVYSQFQANMKEGNYLTGNGDPQTVSFMIPNTPGQWAYSIKSIMIWDANGNYRSIYMNELGFPSGTYPQFTVTHEGYYDRPTITSAVIRNTSIALPGTLEMDMIFGEAKTDVKAVELSLTDGVGAVRTVESSAPMSGQTYSFALDETFEAGAYEVTEVRVTDSSDAVTTYGKDDPAWTFGELQFETTKVDATPALKSAVLNTRDILLPGALEMDMVFGEAKTDVKAVELSLTDGVGAVRTVESSAPVSGQTYSFALDETFAAGKYEVTEVSVTDSSDAVTTYGKDDPAWTFGELQLNTSHFYYVPFEPPIEFQDGITETGRIPLLPVEGAAQKNMTNELISWSLENTLRTDEETTIAGTSGDQAAKTVMQARGSANLVMNDPVLAEIPVGGSVVVALSQSIEETISRHIDERRKSNSILPYILLATGCIVGIGIVIGKRKTYKVK